MLGDFPTALGVAIIFLIPRKSGDFSGDVFLLLGVFISLLIPLKSGDAGVDATGDTKVSKGILGVFTESKSKLVVFPGVPGADSFKKDRLNTLLGVLMVASALGVVTLTVAGVLVTDRFADWGVFFAEPGVFGVAAILTAFEGVFWADFGVFLAERGVFFCGVGDVTLISGAMSEALLEDLGVTAADFFAETGVLAGVFLALVLAGVFWAGVLTGVLLVGIFFFGVGDVTTMGGTFIGVFDPAFFLDGAGVFIISANPSKLASLVVTFFRPTLLSGVFLPFRVTTGVLVVFLVITICSGDKACPVDCAAKLNEEGTS